MSTEGIIGTEFDYGALRNIDQEKYPDRPAEIKREIKGKKADSELVKEARNQCPID